MSGLRFLFGRRDDSDAHRAHPPQLEEPEHAHAVATAQQAGAPARISPGFSAFGLRLPFRRKAGEVTMFLCAKVRLKRVVGGSWHGEGDLWLSQRRMVLTSPHAEHEEELRKAKRVFSVELTWIRDEMFVEDGKEKARIRFRVDGHERCNGEYVIKSMGRSEKRVYSMARFFGMLTCFLVPLRFPAHVVIRGSTGDGVGGASSARILQDEDAAGSGSSPSRSASAARASPTQELVLREPFVDLEFFEIVYKEHAFTARNKAYLDMATGEIYLAVEQPPDPMPSTSASRTSAGGEVAAGTSAGEGGGAGPSSSPVGGNPPAVSGDSPMHGQSADPNAVVPINSSLPPDADASPAPHASVPADSALPGAVPGQSSSNQSPSPPSRPHLSGSTARAAQRADARAAAAAAAVAAADITAVSSNLKLIRHVLQRMTHPPPSHGTLQVPQGAAPHAP
eukprot:tig00020614_g12211.t1